jgi:hypothetical protein
MSGCVGTHHHHFRNRFFVIITRANGWGTGAESRAKEGSLEESLSGHCVGYDEEKEEDNGRK